MIQKIVKDRDFLHKPCRSINLEDSSDMAYAKSVIRDLNDTLATSHTGVGLAASQIGQSVRIFVYKPSRNSTIAIINPEFHVKNKKIVLSSEGCLSIPGLVVPKIMRYKTIVAKGFAEDGKPFSKMLTGLPAIIFQHELDHCDGIIITDKK